MARDRDARSVLNDILTLWELLKTAAQMIFGLWILNKAILLFPKTNWVKIPAFLAGAVLIGALIFLIAIIGNLPLSISFVLGISFNAGLAIQAAMYAGNFATLVPEKRTSAFRQFIFGTTIVTGFFIAIFPPLWLPVFIVNAVYIVARAIYNLATKQESWTKGLNLFEQIFTLVFDKIYINSVEGYQKYQIGELVKGLQQFQGQDTQFNDAYSEAAERLDRSVIIRYFSELYDGGNGHTRYEAVRAGRDISGFMHFAPDANIPNCPFGIARLADNPPSYEASQAAYAAAESPPVPGGSSSDSTSNPGLPGQNQGAGLYPSLDGHR